jgi:hypothetical protein
VVEAVARPAALRAGHEEVSRALTSRRVREVSGYCRCEGPVGPLLPPVGYEPLVVNLP